jgi:predicted phosphodiesterase
MKIVFASDIHYGNHARAEGPPFDEMRQRAFAQEIHDLKPDVLVVTGDCAEVSLDERHLDTFLNLYRNPHGASICIPGNHDLWLAGNFTDPEKQLDWFAKTATRRGWTCLIDQPWVKDGIVLAGGMGWYDYSSRNMSVWMDANDYENHLYGRLNLMPGQRPWVWSDFAQMQMPKALPFCQKRMAEFDACLAAVPADRKWLGVISHFVGFPQLMTSFGAFDTGCAFMGNYSIGQKAVAANANLYYCGHTHRRKEFQLGELTCINNGSMYGEKRYDIINTP